MICVFAILLKSHVLFIQNRKKISFLLDFQLNVLLIISAFWKVTIQRNLFSPIFSIDLQMGNKAIKRRNFFLMHYSLSTVLHAPTKLSNYSLIFIYQIQKTYVHFSQKCSWFFLNDKWIQLCFEKYHQNTYQNRFSIRSWG